MRRLIACLRRGHLPRVHRTAHVTICLRCVPCLTCRSPRTACVGWCASERLS